MEILNTFLGPIITKFEIISHKGDSSDNFNSKIQCSLPYDGDLDDKCAEFIKAFSVASTTSWIVYCRFGKASRFLFRKDYICQHSHKNKAKAKKNGLSKDYNCKAKISIKFLKMTKCTLKTSPLLRKGLDVVIRIDYNHSHDINVLESLSLLKCSVETESMFLNYFNNGMAPKVAKTFHESMIKNEYGSDANMTLANAQENPPIRHVNYLFEQWKTQKSDEILANNNHNPLNFDKSPTSAPIEESSNDVAADLQFQLNRIAQLINENKTDGRINILKNTVEKLSKINNTSDMIIFFASVGKKPRKIKLKPASIAEKKGKGLPSEEIIDDNKEEIKLSGSSNNT